MATIDLTNGIAPQHQFRPVKAELSELRAAIEELDTGNAYPTTLLEKMNRNDLVFTLRSLGGNPSFPAPEPEE
jgi:DnaJ-domain-containing protein 1